MLIGGGWDGNLGGVGGPVQWCALMCSGLVVIVGFEGIVWSSFGQPCIRWLDICISYAKVLTIAWRLLAWMMILLAANSICWC